jgi:hypothetical protein
MRYAYSTCRTGPNSKHVESDEVGSEEAVGSKASAYLYPPKDPESRRTARASDLAMDFLAACIVNRWSSTVPAIYSILHLQHLFLVILHSAGV